MLIEAFQANFPDEALSELNGDAAGKISALLPDTRDAFLEKTRLLLELVDNLILLASTEGKKLAEHACARLTNHPGLQRSIREMLSRSGSEK